MRKEYGYILIVYLLMQLSGFVGYPIVYKVGVSMGIKPSDMEGLAPGYWLVISFTIALFIILLILKKSQPAYRLERSQPSGLASSFFWAFIGVFLALFAQGIAAYIEKLIGIELGSKNTEAIMNLIKTFPLMVIVSSIIGPILEEIVFRKIIFGAIYERFSFWIAAIASSLIFAVAHMDFDHVIIYTAMGFTFSFLYVKTKRILVPIFAHVTMNTLVVIAQLYQDDLERLQKEAENIQGFIGGFFL